MNLYKVARLALRGGATSPALQAPCAWFTMFYGVSPKIFAKSGSASR